MKLREEREREREREKETWTNFVIESHAIENVSEMLSS
jgi:hypothetical protein